MKPTPEERWMQDIATAREFIAEASKRHERAVAEHRLKMFTVEDCPDGYLLGMLAYSFQRVLDRIAARELAKAGEPPADHA